MSQLINDVEVNKLINKVIQEDINEALDTATNKVLEQMKEAVRLRVATRMIAMARSQYNLEYNRGELIIKVQIEDSTGCNHNFVTAESSVAELPATCTKCGKQEWV